MHEIGGAFKRMLQVRKKTPHVFSYRSHVCVIGTRDITHSQVTPSQNNTHAQNNSITRNQQVPSL